MKTVEESQRLVEELRAYLDHDAALVQGNCRNRRS
jgi:hypothetical protein